MHRFLRNGLASVSPGSITRRRLLVGAAVLIAASGIGWSEGSHARDRNDARRWVGTWTASPQAPEPPIIAATPAQFDNQTVRQIVHVSIGGSTLRVRFSNEFGSEPMTIGSARVARHAAGANTVAGTDRVLTFGRRTSVTIPAGAPILSDPVDLDFPALSNLVVSLYLPQRTPANTFHSLGVQTTYVSSPGDHTGVTAFPVASTTQSFFFLTGVTVRVHKRGAAIVAIGDSITDGFAAIVDANRRWPNFLAQRLQARRDLSHLAVLNQGISGNRTLHDIVGPNALARFDRDVLNAPAAKYVILLEGINNVGIPGAFGLAQQAVTADDIITGHRQLIARAKERGLKIYGGTLTPFEGATFPGYFTAEGEAKRQAVNHWIRTSGELDAVIDFDKAIRDPAKPARMLPRYDSGDHLHPNDAGYRAMADAVDLSLFRGGDDDDG